MQVAWAECKKAVQQALSKPALLDKMIAELSPLERALLSEVKRRGGVADGWSLIVYAALRGLAPNKRTGGSVYKQYLSDAPGLGYLGVLIRDGLLIPASNFAPWFSTAYFYGGESNIDENLLFVDAKVLSRVPNEPASPPQPLALEPLTDVTPTAPHPAQRLLELFDIMQLVIEEGGLQITQRGTVSKPLLTRLSKRRPPLEGRLEPLLQLCLTLGLLDPPTNAKDPWRVNLARLHTLRDAPLALSYSFVVEASLQIVADDPWTVGLSSLVSEEVAKRALLECLTVLPEQPVAMEAALSELWARALKYIARRQRWASAEDAEPERPVWFSEALRGAFHALGLVAVAERKDAEKPTETGETRSSVNIMHKGKIVRAKTPSEDDAYQYALKPALGFIWFAQGQSLQGATQAPSVKQLRSLQGLDPRYGRARRAQLADSAELRHFGLPGQAHAASAHRSQLRGLHPCGRADGELYAESSRALPGARGGSSA